MWTTSIERTNLNTPIDFSTHNTFQPSKKWTTSLRQIKESDCLHNDSNCTYITSKNWQTGSHTQVFQRQSAYYYYCQCFWLCWVDTCSYSSPPVPREPLSLSSCRCKLWFMESADTWNLQPTHDSSVNLLLLHFCKGFAYISPQMYLDLIMDMHCIYISMPMRLCMHTKILQNTKREHLGVYLIIRSCKRCACINQDLANSSVAVPSSLMQGCLSSNRIGTAHDTCAHAIHDSMTVLVLEPTTCISVEHMELFLKL